MALVQGLAVVMPLTQALQVPLAKARAAFGDADAVIDDGDRLAADPAVRLLLQLPVPCLPPGGGLVDRGAIGMAPGVLGPA